MKKYILIFIFITTYLYSLTGSCRTNVYYHSEYETIYYKKSNELNNLKIDINVYNQITFFNSIYHFIHKNNENKQFYVNDKEQYLYILEHSNKQVYQYPTNNITIVYICK